MAATAKHKPLHLTLDVEYLLLTTGCSSDIQPQLAAPDTFENSPNATGMEKISFHSNPKEKQCQNTQTITQLHSFHELVK